MSCHVAAYIYGNRQPRNMRGITFNFNGKSRGTSAKSLRTYIESVDPLEYFVLKLGVFSFWIFIVKPFNIR